MRAPRTVAAFAALALLVAACNSTPANSGSANGSGGVLRVGASVADLGTLDPHFANTQGDRPVVDMVYNGLLRFTPGDASTFQPSLATSLPVAVPAGGGQTWSFALRKGVMCQPSPAVPAYELTSDDVLWSLQKAADKATSAYAGDYAGMTFAAVDQYTVTVTTPAPLSTALFYPKFSNYGGGFIICKKAYDALGPTGLKTHPVGTGPFVFQSYTPGEKVVLTANAAYYLGKPKLDGVEYRYMPDLNSREAGLVSGQLDVANGTPDIKWAEKMPGNPGIKVDIFGAGEVQLIHFCTTCAPLDKLEVRQAIAYALSRDEFQALAGPQVSEQVLSPIPAQFMAGGLTRDEVTSAGLDYATNLDKAKALLTQAGLPNGFSLDLVEAQQISNSSIYESMQAQLAKVGIKLNLTTVDLASYGTQIRQGSNAIVVYAALRPNADVYLTQFFHSDSTIVTGKTPNTNFSRYSAIDDLITEARSEPDATKQASLWKEAQVHILQDMAAYPIQYLNQVYARSDKVDYGHSLKSVLALYPGIDETTSLAK